MTLLSFQYHFIISVVKMASFITCQLAGSLKHFPSTHPAEPDNSPTHLCSPAFFSLNCTAFDLIHMWGISEQIQVL